MAGSSNKKRTIDGKLQRPTKKQRRIHQYNSDSDAGEEEESFDAVNLLDSDDDIHNAKVDEAADANDNDSSSSDEGGPVTRKAKKTKSKSPKAPAEEAQEAESDQEEAEDDDDDDDDDEDSVLDDEFDLGQPDKKRKAKRNDPSAFATSLSKILSTKLSTSKRADPVLARSAAAHEASKAAVDTALESKAKRQIKEQKRQAMEKGRVKDVLIASRTDTAGEPETTTSEILETERKLRKVAQRGVVQMFNAVRTAQVKATAAERGARKDGMIGMKNREEKVNELSKKGFLELIASGGGGLKKGGIEEA